MMSTDRPGDQARQGWGNGKKRHHTARHPLHLPDAVGVHVHVASLCAVWLLGTRTFALLQPGLAFLLYGMMLSLSLFGLSKASPPSHRRA